jgi:beta-barrel assembly-enhancing protease
MTTFSAVYYDGQSSVPHPVKVTVYDEDRQLIISFDQDTVYWNISDVKVDTNGRVSTLAHINIPNAFLETTEKDIHILLKKNDPSGLISSRVKGRSGFLKVVGLCILILAILAGLYFYTLPFVAEKAVVLVPSSFDDQFGETVFNSLVNENERDSVKTKQMQAFADAIDFKSEKKLKVIVMNSEEINAYALPDGHIVVYSGILKKIDKPEELAALLSHEASHVNQRHSMKLLCRNFAGFFFVSVLMGDASGIMAVIADNANTLRNLAYSRDYEKEADLKGIEILQSNHIDLNGMVDLLEMLDSKDPGVMPDFLSTHPLTKSRIEYVKRESADNNQPDPHPELIKLFQDLKHTESSAKY